MKYHKTIYSGNKRESVKASKAITAAENYGWVVEDWDAQEAYEFACEYLGKEYIDDSIIQAISNEELASCLAFIFRMNDFREWEAYKSGEDLESEE